MEEKIAEDIGEEIMCKLRELNKILERILAQKKYE